MDVSQKYSNAEISSMGQVELESRAFIRAASSLNSIKEHWDTEQDHLMEKPPPLDNYCQRHERGRLSSAAGNPQQYP